MVIIVMGVAGAGKTTVGSRLSDELGWPFHDADDLHPPENIATMRSGAPLTETHREPWLAALAKLIGEYVRAERSMVLACSALRRSYREALLSQAPDLSSVRLVHLHADDELLRDRISGRSGHFFPSDLLATQLTTFEVPAAETDVPVLTLDASLPVDELVATIRRTFGV
jgi:gluconokinase